VESIYPDNRFVSFVKGLGFESIIDYAESHGRCTESWSFVLAMKNSESRASWFLSDAEMNIKIAHRVMPTRSEVVPFLFFDGATMAHYQFAPRQGQFRCKPPPFGRDQTSQCRCRRTMPFPWPTLQNTRYENSVYRRSRKRPFASWSFITWTIARTTPPVPSRSCRRYVHCAPH
jgi:hypothetical protein